MVSAGGITQPALPVVGVIPVSYCRIQLPFLMLLVACNAGRVWAVPGPVLESLEQVTDQAEPGDAGNAWGGHQTRIVRTRRGVFTAYTVAGQGYKAKEWRLAQRTANGWSVVGRGIAGREPVNLLQGPDDTLYLTAWPEGHPHLWTSRPGQGGLTFTDTAIPGDWGQTDWPYQAAAMSADGFLYLLASGGEKPGSFNWTRYSVRDGAWSFHSTPTDYRFCYTYVVPGPARELSLVSTRDVRWESLGYTQPAGAFGYVFNAVGAWFTPDVGRDPLHALLVREEPPTAQQPAPYCNAQTDAYRDTGGRLHVLYWLRGANTGGKEETRHVILRDGQVLQDVPLPPDAGHYCRLIQDAGGDFYLITASTDQLLVYRSSDAIGWGAPVRLSLQGYRVAYSGIAIAAPRCGTPLSNIVDGVFPAGQENQWIYFRLRLK